MGEKEKLEKEINEYEDEKFALFEAEFLGERAYPVMQKATKALGEEIEKEEEEIKELKEKIEKAEKE